MFIFVKLNITRFISIKVIFILTHVQLEERLRQEADA